MTEWKEYKLGEIATFISEKVSVKDISIENYISTENMVSDKGGIIVATNKPLDGTITKYYPNNILVSNIRPYFKKIWFSNKDGGCSNDVLCFEANTKYINSKYLYFLLSQDLFFDYVMLGSKGCKMPRGDKSHIMNWDISLPPLPEQIRIASILSSLDDKIDLLHRENKTLEDMAETLFRQWFIEEAKEDWEEGKLGDYVELVNGVSYKGDELQPSNVAMVTLKSFDRNGGFRMDGYKEFTGKFKKEQVLYDGDLVVAHTDITQEADVIGNPVIVIGKNQYETITFSMDVVKVVSKSEFFSNSFLYYLMKTQAFKEHCLGYANGSTVLHLSKKAIPEFEFHIPPKIIAQSFQKQLESINKKILNNNNEIQTLIQMRDGLLPKLMSGEVKI